MVWTMALSDDVERLTQIIVRMHQRNGEAARLRQATGRPASHIAKLAGVSAETIYAWEAGTVQPSTAQALAWLQALQYDVPTPAEVTTKAARAMKRDG